VGVLLFGIACAGYYFGISERIRNFRKKERILLPPKTTEQILEENTIASKRFWTVFELVTKEVNGAAFLVLGSQHGCKSSLINSKFSLLEGKNCSVAGTSPGNLDSKTNETGYFPFFKNSEWIIYDTKGFEVGSFSGPFNEIAKIRQNIKGLIQGIDMVKTPSLVILVISPTHYSNYPSEFGIVVDIIEEEKIPYVVVITCKDLIPEEEQKIIQKKIKLFTKTDQVLWTTNFGPHDEIPRDFSNLEIQTEQYNLWFKIYDFFQDWVKLRKARAEASNQTPRWTLIN